MKRNRDFDNALGWFGIVLICFVLACLITFIKWLSHGNNLNWTLIAVGWLGLGGYLFIARAKRGGGQGHEIAYYLVVPPVAIGLVVSMILTAYDVLNTPLYILMLAASIAGIVYWILRGPRVRFPWRIPNLMGWSLLTLFVLGLVSAVGLPLEAKHDKDRRRDESNSYLATASELINDKRFEASRRQLHRAEKADSDNPRVELLKDRLRNEEDQANLEQEILSAIRARDYKDALDLAETGDFAFRRRQQELIVKKIVNDSRYELYGVNYRKQLERMIADLKIATNFGPTFTYALEAKAEGALAEAQRKLRQLDNPQPITRPGDGSTSPSDAGGSGAGGFDLPGDVPLIPGT